MLNKLFVKLFTTWKGMTDFKRTIIEFVLDCISVGSVLALLYHLNCPWWGYVLTFVCCIIQKAITDKP